MTQDTQVKRVLVVDDESSVAEALAINLEKLGPEYVIDTAVSGQDALEKIGRTQYALMITDYAMPNMNGLDLAKQVRQQAPGIQIILMTAYGTDDLQRTVDQLHLTGYFNKPVPIPEIRQIVKNVLARVYGTEAKPTPQPSATQALHKHLDALRSDTGARCVMLLSSGGYPVEVAGQADELDITSLGALIAANFMAAAELANLLGSGSVFKSSHHEGPDYNFYAHDVNGDFLLAVIYDAKTKPGVVWFYAKKTVDELAPLCVIDRIIEFESIQEWNDSLDAQFDEFDTGDDSIPEPSNTPHPADARPSFEEALRRGMLGRELK